VYGEAGDMRVLNRCGFKPKAVLDVGANVGDWTREFTRKFPSSKFFMIEGNENCRSNLDRMNIPFEISLVGSFEGNITYYKTLLSNTGTGNSIFKEDGKAFQGNNFVEVQAPTNTIDNIVRKHGVGPFQFMKMDIQGAELEGLKGAVETLKTVEVILMEAPVVEYNMGSPSFLDLHAHMDRIGFALFDIWELHRDKDGVMLQFDVVWVRMTSKLWSTECTHFKRPSYFDTENPNRPFYHGGGHKTHKAHWEKKAVAAGEV
jgi:FkbM family methyltransferase